MEKKKFVKSLLRKLHSEYLMEIWGVVWGYLTWKSGKSEGARYGMLMGIRWRESTMGIM